MNTGDKQFTISHIMKLIIICSIGITAIIASSWAGTIHANDNIETDIDNKLFLNELQNAVYVGNYYTVEAVGNLIVSHNIISMEPRKETVTGYMSFMANDSINKEMGNIGVIAEFDLREPSKRICHEIIKVGEKINVGDDMLTVGEYIGDPVIYDYSPSLLYYTFRCINKKTKNGCTVGFFVDKKKFKKKDAHYVSMDGHSLTENFEHTWSNTRILKHKNFYYRAFRDVKKNRILLSRSLDLKRWITWLDISSAMSFVKENPKNTFDETDIAIDSVNSVLYFAVRSPFLVLGKVEINDKPFIIDMSFLSDINPTRPSLVFFNKELYLLCNTKRDKKEINIVNGTVVNRAYPILFRLNTNFEVIKKWTGFSCIGGNYQCLYPYKTQLLCGLNFNKQGLSNTASLERCGVYFTPLYSISYTY